MIKFVSFRHITYFYVSSGQPSRLSPKKTSKGNPRGCPKKMTSMKELTKVEEEVMQIIWQKERGVVRDFINEMNDPKPPYSTISSVVRILEKKGFVSHKAYGKTHEYFPIITKDEYRKFAVNGLVKRFFAGSASNMLSFFAKENQLEPEELKSLIDSINENDKSDE